MGILSAERDWADGVLFRDVRCQWSSIARSMAISVGAGGCQIIARRAGRERASVMVVTSTGVESGVILLTDSFGR